MDFPAALKEVEREDGFWAHLVASDGRAFSWKRYEEIPDGKWSAKVLDEGESNAYEVNGLVPRTLPWITWIARGAPDDLRFTLGGGAGGRDFILARVISQMDRKFSWVRVERTPDGNWHDTTDVGELNAYESNDRVVHPLPRIYQLVPRSIKGELMFNGGI